jgi:hypothetical protein
MIRYGFHDLDCAFEMTMVGMPPQNASLQKIGERGIFMGFS